MPWATEDGCGIDGGSEVKDHCQSSRAHQCLGQKRLSPTESIPAAHINGSHSGVSARESGREEQRETSPSKTSSSNACTEQQKDSRQRKSASQSTNGHTSDTHSRQRMIPQKRSRTPHVTSTGTVIAHRRWRSRRIAREVCAAHKRSALKPGVSPGALRSRLAGQPAAAAAGTPAELSSEKLVAAFFPNGISVSI